ncbi:phosphatidylinositol 3-kinase catalytic subunit alpha, beta, delta [Anopheles sinensis]|uniref:Phosphatidylinositol 3-kinase catalytic subunit alpha, beta, delta n=1 Tax=Anopheles sinensis TaxID=74873 RepID=A0A084VJC4_ANOSI|nr:phosphatidylinositol 3-kinase catalytic subunit alpha, beta, delta [Anopheles sinensis]
MAPPIPQPTKPVEHTAPRVFHYDFWKNPSESVDLDVLMPNGVIITMNQSIYLTLTELKGYVWEVAESKPLYRLLGDKNMYCFSTLASGTTNNGTYEVDDESRRLLDVQPVFGIFRFVEKKNVSVNSTLINNINALLGSGLSEKTLKNPEVNDFRTKMSQLGEEIGIERAAMSRMERIAYQYPVKLASSTNIPEQIKKDWPTVEGVVATAAATEVIST